MADAISHQRQTCLYSVSKSEVDFDESVAIPRLNLFLLLKLHLCPICHSGYMLPVLFLPFVQHMLTLMLYLYICSYCGDNTQDYEMDDMISF